MYPWAASERLPVSGSMYLNGKGVNSHPVIKASDSYFGHLYRDMDHHQVSLKMLKNDLTPYALQEKKPFMSFVKERSLSYLPTTSRKSSATLT